VDVCVAEQGRAGVGVFGHCGGAVATVDLDLGVAVALLQPQRLVAAQVGATGRLQVYCAIPVVIVLPHDAVGQAFDRNTHLGSPWGGYRPALAKLAQDSINVALRYGGRDAPQSSVLSPAPGRLTHRNPIR